MRDQSSESESLSRLVFIRESKSGMAGCSGGGSYGAAPYAHENKIE